MGKYATPAGYFNATEMVVPDSRGVKLKPNHFLDNQKVQVKLSACGKQPVVHRGRGACTFIPLELKDLFIAWMALNTKD